MFAVCMHAVTVRHNGERHGWPPRIVSQSCNTVREAARLAAAERRGQSPDDLDLFQVVEIIRRPARGVAVVREVTRALGGYSRGPEYEAECWG